MLVMLLKYGHPLLIRDKIRGISLYFMPISMRIFLKMRQG